MKDKIRRIENELNNYNSIQNPENIRFLIELAEKWATVQEIFTDPGKSVDEALNYLSNNT